MINAEKYSRSVAMSCPTCGGGQFEHDPENLDDTALIKCASCQLTLTRAQLVEANNENVSEHLSEMGKEMVEDLKNDLKKAFFGNKHIKIK